jgi:HSP20 family protein
MDIHESENALEITAELPGVCQNDVDLRIEDETLTIRGEKRDERRGNRPAFGEMLERIASNGVKTTRAKRFAVSTMMAALPSDQAITTAPPLPGERLSRCLRLPTPLLPSCSQAGCRERKAPSAGSLAIA